MPYSMYINGVLFPVTPSKITMKVKNQNKTFNLINEGEVNLIKDAGLTDIQIDELLLPNFRYPFAVYTGVFHRAEYYLKKLDQWKSSNKPVVFLVTRSSPGRKFLLYSTRMNVTIEDYQIIEDVKNGMDVSIKLNMKQYKDWGIKKLVLKKSSSSNSTTKKAVVKKTRSTKEIAKTYIVVKGDCLIKIAKKQLNDSSRWKEIYNLNKSVIESTAKKYGRKSSSNGWWIYPGTKLKLPS